MKSKIAPVRRRTGIQETSRATIATPEDHYRAEKARRANDRHPDAELMEQAKQEYLKLIAEGAAKGQGGRPKKKQASGRDAKLGTTNADTDVEDVDLDIES